MEINEGKLKEILGNQRKEYQDYLGSVAEDFKSQVQLLAESVLKIEIEDRNWIKGMKGKMAK